MELQQHQDPVSSLKEELIMLTCGVLGHIDCSCLELSQSGFCGEEGEY